MTRFDIRQAPNRINCLFMSLIFAGHFIECPGKRKQEVSRKPVISLFVNKITVNGPVETNVLVQYIMCRYCNLQSLFFSKFPIELRVPYHYIRIVGEGICLLLQVGI